MSAERKGEERQRGDEPEWMRLEREGKLAPYRGRSAPIAAEQSVEPEIVEWCD